MGGRGGKEQNAHISRAKARTRRVIMCSTNMETLRGINSRGKPNFNPRSSCERCNQEGSHRLHLQKVHAITGKDFLSQTTPDIEVPWNAIVPEADTPAFTSPGYCESALVTESLTADLAILRSADPTSRGLQSAGPRPRRTPPSGD